MNTSIYIKEPLLNRIKKKAKRRKISLSKYVERSLELSLEERLPAMPIKRLTPLKNMISLGGDTLTDTENFHE
jgi:hypothetical protein